MIDKSGGNGHATGEAPSEQDGATPKRSATVAARSKTTAARLAAAIHRDELAASRDSAAAARDHAAQARDKAAAARDAAAVAQIPRVSEASELARAIGTVGTLRLSSAARRQHSELERLAAAKDREAAAADRERAAGERRDAGLDDLTGVLRRGMGEVALTREIERSRRRQGSLVIAIIDVDDLKAVNDNLSHAAGDALLRDVGRAIVTTLRPYDVTVRWGGDEFVCALSNVTLELAASRIGEIQTALATIQPGTSFSAGLAELGDDDNLESVILNADAALYSTKTSRNT